MKPHRVDHPDGMYALVGFDADRGWIAELLDVQGRLGDEYDAFTSGEESTVQGILRFLIGHEFFTAADVTEAVADWLPHITEVEEIDDPGVRRAADVILALRMIGAD